MDTIKTNYIRNTNPELQEQFVEILRRIPHFSNLSDELLEMLFQYAKFVPLKDKDRPVLEGMYGQEIYTLIRGELEVLIKTDTESEKQVDVIYKPFSLFGEQCILGDLNNASIKARGEALLLGIDISALPDMIDAMENPDAQLEDTAYLQNTALYTIFAAVLTERLDRLIKDEYKLMQRIMILHNSDSFNSAWQQNSLLTTIYNEFCSNELDADLKVQLILKTQLSPLFENSPSLNTLIESTPVDTQQVYMELIRMKTLGEPVDPGSLLLEITQEISENAWLLERYKQDRSFDPYDVPICDCLSNFLTETYRDIIETGVLARSMTLEQFLDAFVSDRRLNPAAFVKTLRSERWTSDEFGLACCMYIICKSCISRELVVNQGIAKAIHYLISLNTPRQFIESTQTPNQHLVKEVVDLFQIDEDGSEGSEEAPKKAAHQESVEDLLSEFGL